MDLGNYNYKRTEEKLLDIQDVTLKFGTKTVLHNVNATISNLERDQQVEGQVVCFLGPSGIGKTQLSRVIAGLQAPTSGQVLLKDKVTKPGEVCMVPQNYPMFEYATVRENLLIAGKQANLSTQQINEKATTYIHTFGLEQYLHMYPKSLSGGTRQRVAIARQMMCASSYLVMDEPFSGLDPIMKRRAMDAIVKLSQMNTYNTIIIVTHDVTEGMSIADTVWLMGYLNPHAKEEGATILKQIDLAELGFAWRPDITRDPDFLKLVADVKDEFQNLI